MRLGTTGRDLSCELQRREPSEPEELKFTKSLSATSLRREEFLMLFGL
ncbi:MAG: hypothetical protein QXM12_02530 [Nitrososphaerota archaeon]